MAVNVLTDLFNRIGWRTWPRHGRETTEKQPEWYDEAYNFGAKDEYAKHYTESRYYFIWRVIADRIPRELPVLEIGCGTGQLAHLLLDHQVQRYSGFDFSPEAIRLARSRCPQLDFGVENALTSKRLDRPDYRIVVSTEVLEHIQDDLRVLSRIRQGVRCLLTVPNFPYESHVRHFESAESVSARYGCFFETHRVDWFPMSPNGDGLFLCDGVRNSSAVAHDV